MPVDDRRRPLGDAAARGRPAPVTDGRRARGRPAEERNAPCSEPVGEPGRGSLHVRTVDSLQGGVEE